MNSLEILAKQIQLEIPQAEIMFDRPESDSGIWHLDVNAGDRAVVVTWKPQKPFGVSTSPSVAYGEMSHESYGDRLSTVQRVVQLLKSGGKTTGTRTAALKNVRQARKVSQQELARKLQVEQGSISKFENRQDFQLSTLRKVMNELGGKLEIYVRFPDESFRIALPEPPRKTGDRDRIYVGARDSRTKKRRDRNRIRKKVSASKRF